MASARLAVLTEPKPVEGITQPSKMDSHQLNADAVPFLPTSTVKDIADISPSPASSLLPSSIVDSLPVNPASLDTLTQRFTDQIQVGHLTPPEPGIFTSEALQYSSWKSAFNILIDSKKNPRGREASLLQKGTYGDQQGKQSKVYLLIHAPKRTPFGSGSKIGPTCLPEMGWPYVNSLIFCSNVFWPCQLTPV